MRTRRLLSPLLTGLLVAASALPTAAMAQGAWYGGLSAGQSYIRAEPGEIERGFLLDDGFTASGTTLDRRDAGWKAFAGYRINRVLAAEGGYADLGEASFDTTIVGAPPGTTPAPPFPIRGTASAKGVFLAGLVHLPLSPASSLFAKAGAFHSEARFTETIPGTGLERVSRSVRRTDALYGAGLEWGFGGSVGLRLEWERFRGIGRGIGGREGRDVDFVSVGLYAPF